MSIDTSMFFGVRPPDFESPQDRAAKTIGLRSALQQEDAQKIALENAKMQQTQMLQAQQDDQTMRELYAQSGGDLNTLFKLAGGKVSPQIMMNLQKSLLEQREKLATIGEKELAQRKYILERGGAAAEQLKQMPDANARAAAWPGIRASLQSAGVPVADLPEQYPGDQWVTDHSALGLTQQQLIEAEFNRRKDKREESADTRAQSAETRAAGLFPFQLRSAEADANLKTAEAKGEKPLQPADILQNKTAVRGQDLSASTARRGQDLHYTATMGAAQVGAGQHAFQNANALRDDLRKDTSNFGIVANSYGQIQAAKSGSPISDIALMYAYMKMLDPNSVVREGEYATAQNAGGVPAQIVGMYNHLRGGGKLTDTVRNGIVTQAESVYGQAKSDADKVIGQYKSIAERNGLNWGDVYVDKGSTAEKPAAPQYKVGETVMYNGKPHKVTAIKNGKLVLDGN